MATWHVDASVAVSGDGTTAGSAFKTISEALAAAAMSGDTILVDDGVYNESLLITKQVTLLSVNGRENTQIVGSALSGRQGTIEIAANTNNVTIGAIGAGFTIVGFDGPPAIERAAIALVGAQDGLVIQGNDVVANGDAGLLAQFGQPITNALIDSNIFSGKTFVGDEPGGFGFATQDTTPNVPRQLVVIGSNNGTSSNITFTNNDVTGTAGGINSLGQPQGNTLVTIDAAGSTISGNDFSGFTNRFATQLRVREEDTDIQNNTFSNDEGGNLGIYTEFSGGETPGIMSGNQVNYGSGNDTIFATAGNDAIDGGAGSDTYDMTAAGSAGSFVDLGSGLAFSTTTGIDTLVSIENVKGSAGTDGLFGNGEDNVFIATAGADVIDGRGGIDTYDASSATGALTVDLKAGTVSGAFSGTVTSIENVIGGSGSDTVVLAGSREDAVIETGDAPGTYTVTIDGTTYTLSSVGKLVFDDGEIIVVGKGGTSDFATIQAGINAASDGDHVFVLDGEYVEQVLISGLDDLTVTGEGAVTVKAPADVSPSVTSSSNRALNGVIAVTDGQNVVLENLDVDGDGRGNTVNGSNPNYVGVIYRNASGGLTDVDITGIHDPYPGGTTVDGLPIVSGQRGIGVQVDNNSLMSFFMHGGSISNFQKNATVFNFADLDVTGVTVNGGGAQPITAQNGFQALNSTGSITGNFIYGLGYAGPSATVATGILGYQNTDLDITDNTIVGTEGATADSKAVAIYIYDFGVPNSGGTIEGNIISFVDTGISVFGQMTPDGIKVGPNTVTDAETGVDFSPAAGLAVPFDVTGSDLADTLGGSDGDDTLTSLDGDDVLDGGAGGDTMTGGDGNDTYYVDDAGDVVIELADQGTDTVYSSIDYALTDNVENLILIGTAVSGTGNDLDNEITGNAEDNVLSGGGGNDTIDGGDGIDTVTYGDEATVTYDGANGVWSVVSAADGTDTLVNVEMVDAANGRILLVGAGGYKTLQAAVDDAQPGDTIMVGEGVFKGNVIIDKELTIIGVNADHDGASGDRVGESTLLGRIVVNSSANVSLIGLEFRSDLTTGTTGNGAPALSFLGSGNHSVSNSVFFNELAGGGSDSRAVMIGSGATGAITVDGNAFTGTNAAAKYGTAAWATGIWSDGNSSNLVLTDNTFTGVRTGMNLDGYDDSGNGGNETTVSGNSFEAAGTAISIGVPGDETFTGITDNDFGGADTDFNFRNVETPVTIDLSTTISGPVGDGVMAVYGGKAGDTITGTDGVDYILGDGVAPTAGNYGTVGGADVIRTGAGDDIVYAGAGDDIIEGGAGSDLLDGGTGVDTAEFEAGSISIVGGKWTVTDGDDVDTLTNIEKITIDGQTYILVDEEADGGFGSLQAAIDAAGTGDIILVAPGSYTELTNYNPTLGNNSGSGNPVGLLVYKDGITIQGVDASGAFIQGADDVAATIVSGAQSNWGTNFFITGSNVTINGLRFEATAPGSTVNKAIEVVGDGFTLTTSYVGAVSGKDIAATIYINDKDVPVGTDLDTFISKIKSYLISGNMLEGSFVTANGTGWNIPAGDISMVVSGNEFFKMPGFDPLYAVGIYVTGNQDGIGWRNAPAVAPELSGNSFTADYGLLFRALDDDPANIPDRDYIDAFTQQNDIGVFAYVADDSGEPKAVDTGTNTFYVRRTLEQATADAQAGDRIVLRTDADPKVLTVTKEGLTIEVVDGSGEVDIIIGAGIDDVSLAGSEDVDVTGNGGNNTIIGNDGNNSLFGGNGDDRIDGGGGNDLMFGQGGSDTAVFTADFADLVITRLGDTYTIYNKVTGETDIASGFEKFSIGGSADISVTGGDADIIVTDGPGAGPSITAIDGDEVAEDAELGDLVATVNATDPHLVFGDELTYALVTADGGSTLFDGPFAIDGDGNITVSGALDHETTASYTFFVKVSDAAGNSVWEEKTITVDDVNEAPTGILTDIPPLAINDGQEGQILSAITAIDQDVGDTFTWLIEGDLADRFEIVDGFVTDENPGGLVLKLKEGMSIDYETEQTSLVLDITVTDSGGKSYKLEGVALEVLDVNEAPGGGGQLDASVSMERASTDTPLGLVAPDDPEGDTLTFTVVTLPALGSLKLGGVDLVLNQELTAAEYESLTFSFPNVVGSQSVQFLVDDGTSSVPINVSLIATPGVNSQLFGGAGVDRLDGAFGNDELRGRAGNDILIGGIGNDKLIGGGGADLLDGGEGRDTALYTDQNWGDLVISLADPSQNTGAAAGDTYVSIERIVSGVGNDTLIGDDAGNYLEGGAGNDKISGGAGNDRLVGGDGMDTIAGGLGRDTLFGGADADVFVFDTTPAAANADRIMDFEAGLDRIGLDSAIFSAIGDALDAEEFVESTNATTADHRIVYNQATGELFYDADGNGSGAQVRVAILDNKAALTHADFDMLGLSA